MVDCSIHREASVRYGTMRRNVTSRLGKVSVAGSNWIQEGGKPGTNLECADLSLWLRPYDQSSDKSPHSKCSARLQQRHGPKRCRYSLDEMNAFTNSAAR